MKEGSKEIIEKGVVKVTNKGSKAAGEFAEKGAKKASKEGEEAAEEILQKGANKPKGIKEEDFGEVLTEAERGSIETDPRFIDRTSRAEEFDMAGYKKLTAEGKGSLGKVGDGLDSDEVIQNLFFRELHGVERSSDLIKDNPAIALTPRIHKMIKNLKKPQIKGMSAREVLRHHMDEMRKTGEIPPEVLVIIERNALAYIQNLGM